MAKKNRSEYSRLRELFRKRIRRLEKKGYFFPEGYMPPPVRKPTQEDVDFLKKQTLDEIYRQAKWGKWLGKEAIEGTIKRELTRQEGKARAFINLAKINAKKELDKNNRYPISEIGENRTYSKSEFNKQLGKEISKFYFKLLEEKNPVAEHIDLVIPNNQARDYFENEIWIHNAQVREERNRAWQAMSDEEKDEVIKWLNEQQRKSDESISQQTQNDEYEEDSKPWREMSEEEKDEYFSQIDIDEEPEEEQRITDESIEKTKKDPRFEEWMREYKQERLKKPKERQYAYEPEAVYAGILDRIAQFEKLMDSDVRFSMTHGGNHQYALRLQGILNMQIKLEGFDNVMKRLADKGQKIEELLQRMLFQESRDEKINPNFQELVEIIKGDKLSVKEAEMVEQYAIEHSYNPETYEEGEE